MTDYFYQTRARNRGFENEDRQEPAEPRDYRYSDEDQAYWAEADAALPPAADEALWYEDRARSPEEEPGDVGGEEAEAAAAWVAPPLPRQRETFDALPPEDPVEDEDGGWSEPATSGQRAYVPGGQAAAARAAAASGERNIRFDPTKERGAAYYDTAARHSRHVRLLKITLPVIAILSVAGFFVVMNIGEKGDGLPALTLSGINLDTREITMDKPHISGFDGTKRAYEVNAAKAVQALGNPKVVNLETIDARFAVTEDVRAHLLAKAGIYDANTQKLELSGGINVTTDSGYAGTLDAARVDIEKGTVFTDTGVALEGKEGSITADSLEVLDRGKHIFFRGNVKVRFDPPEETAGADKPAAKDTNESPDAAATDITETRSDGAS